jgi:hypothetical protein
MRRLLLTAPLLLALGACQNMNMGNLVGPPPVRNYPVFFAEDSSTLGDNARGIVAMAVDEAKARETLTAVLKDLMEACTFLSQGDDFDRARVCQDVAAAIVEG